MLSRKALCKVVVAALASSVLVIGAPPERASADIARRYLQFNLCGSTLADCLDNRTQQDLAATRIAQKILNDRYSVVTLNEICQFQYIQIKNALATGGFAMDGTFIDTRLPSRGATGCGSDLFGNAVLGRGTLNAREFYWSCSDAARRDPNNCIRNNAWTSDLEQRAMACARVELASRHALRGCSFHAISGGSANDSLRTNQLVDAADILNPKAATGTAEMLGGDLNRTPPAALTPFSSQFADVDAPSTYTPTFTSYNPSSKIDYILLTTVNGRFYNLTHSWASPATNCGGPLPGGYCSDHRLLLGWGTLTDI
jgi:hypothetical protein